MRNFFTFLLLLVVFLPAKFTGAATFTVTNSGFTFSPSTLTISVGDKVTFSLAPIHNAVEVSQATWNANGFTSNGGFNVPFGGGDVTFNTAGTYYYVCTVHASSGMKGQIIVTSVTGLKQNSLKVNSLSVYPNPAGPYFTLKFSLPGSTAVNIDLVDLSGRRVKNLITSVFDRGDWTKVFSSAGLVPGMYFIRYTSGGKTETANLIIGN